VSNYDPDLSVWGLNLQNQINGLLDTNGKAFFHGVTVVGANVGASTIIFDIKFSGLDAARAFDQLQLIDNSLTPTGLITVFISFRHIR
jgi:hypothetical protein